ncbi:MAG: CDP-glucose 4,6-dehydratase [Clostridiales bacterium]|nr:CDP-glucose 4,6-dehydratase [Clostridiales bacterium]
METVELAPAGCFGGAFYRKNVLVTGHTGFKGSWLCVWLGMLGARLTGYALDPVNDRDNFVMCGLSGKMIDLRGDVRDRARLNMAFEAYRPELVFHLAAQPLVLRSYREPAETFETNVMGTVNVLEAARSCGSVKAVIIVTSDKCYENREPFWGCREDDPMGGLDPYSASKGCAELAAASYRHSFFPEEKGKTVASVRAGNVFGGGDWSEFRLIPDCIRALEANRPVELRSPESVRPWQFVLEPLSGYLLLASQLLEGVPLDGAWNFGPEPADSVSVGELAELLAEIWGGSARVRFSQEEDPPREAAALRLDCTKAKLLLGWRPRMDLRTALEYTVEWYRHDGDFLNLCESQIAGYCERM